MTCHAHVADAKQCFGLGGERAEAVGPLVAQNVEFVVVGDECKFSVRVEAQFLGIHIVVWQERIHHHVDLQLERCLWRLTLHVGDRLTHHLAVQVVTDRGDSTTLLFAEQTPRTTQLQITASNLVAASQVGGLPDGLQTFVRDLREHLIAWMEKERICLLSCAAHTAAQLVQLAKAEAMRVLHHQGVDGGHVDAALDDGGTHEHVELAVPKIDHGSLEECFVHLAMCKGDAGLGHQTTQLLGALFDGFHAVVHPEHLTLAQQLAANGFGSHTIVVRGHVRTNRLAIGRWRVEERHVANTDQAHLQRARNRRCRQGEYVHVGAHHLDGLLVLHAEALLFIHHQQAEVLETNVFLQQSVGSNHHVDLTRGKTRDDSFGLGRRDEA